MNELIFCFTGQEAQLLLESLVELPFKKSADLIFKIQRQAAEQTQDSRSESRPESKTPAEGEVNTNG